MKEIIKNYYYIASGITGSKVNSYYIAIFTVSLICLTFLTGLAFLLIGMGPTKYVIIAFRFPFNIASWLVIFFALLKSYPSSRIAYRNPNKQTNKLLVVVTMAVAIALAAYLWLLKTV